MGRVDRNNPSVSVFESVSVSLRLLRRSAQAVLSSPPFPSFPPTTMSSQHHTSSPNLVGGHYRVGRKIGEGSFGVIFEGPLFFLSLFLVLFPNLSPFFRDRDEPSQLTNRRHQIRQSKSTLVPARVSVLQPDPTPHRNPERPKPPS